MTTFHLGSISTDTEDLLPAYAEALERLTGKQYEPVIAAMEARAKRILRPDNVNFQGLMEYLHDRLNELCPPFVYFGPAPDDPTSFGFWPDWDALDEALHNADADHPGSPIETRLEDDGVIVHRYEPGEATVMDLDRQVLWSTV